MCWRKTKGLLYCSENDLPVLLSHFIILLYLPTKLKGICMFCSKGINTMNYVMWKGNGIVVLLACVPSRLLLIRLFHKNKDSNAVQLRSKKSLSRKRVWNTKGRQPSKQNTQGMGRDEVRKHKQRWWKPETLNTRRITRRLVVGRKKVAACYGALALISFHSFCFLLISFGSISQGAFCSLFQ